MPFVKYTEPGRSFAAKATIAASGRLRFNNGARNRFRLEQFSHCVLYFDADTRRIGVELTNDPCAEGAITLRHRATGSDVFAKSFLDFFDINSAATTTYSVTLDSETKWLVLDLAAGKQRRATDRARAEEEREVKIEEVQTWDGVQAHLAHARRPAFTCSPH